MTETQLKTLSAAWCTACGAAMAADQRYCLACGERNGPPRVPPSRPQAAAVAAAPPPAAEPPRSSTPVWIATVGILLLAMGVGVLIGRSGADPAPVRAGAPITVSVPTGAPAAVAPAATTAPAAKKHGKSKKSSAKAGGKATTATKKDLQQLDNLTPEQYQKKSKNLPSTVGTQGKAPPKDNKKAGGGSSFEEIG